MLNRKLIKNKIYGIILIVIGIISAMIDGDITFLILTLIFGLPLLFTRKRWIY